MKRLAILGSTVALIFSLAGGVIAVAKNLSGSISSQKAIINEIRNNPTNVNSRFLSNLLTDPEAIADNLEDTEVLNFYQGNEHYVVRPEGYESYNGGNPWPEEINDQFTLTFTNIQSGTMTDSAVEETTANLREQIPIGLYGDEIPLLPFGDEIPNYCDLIETVEYAEDGRISHIERTVLNYTPELVPSVQFTQIESDYANPSARVSHEGAVLDETTDIGKYDEIISEIQEFCIQ